MITKYGYFTVGITVIIVFVIILAGMLISNSVIKWILIGLGAALLLFTLYFFRNPQRTAPEANDVIVSPADGRVMLIKEVMPDEFIKEESWQISIFMSPLDVHVNRIPIDGIVRYTEYVEGEYLVAYHDKADKRNERNLIGIENKTYGKVLFTQVAGFVARRIVSTLEVGDTVKAGAEFGMIKFGSRVDVIVPKSKWIVKVPTDTHVTAGETILFEYEKKTDN